MVEDEVYPRLPKEQAMKLIKDAVANKLKCGWTLLDLQLHIKRHK